MQIAVPVPRPRGVAPSGLGPRPVLFGVVILAVVVGLGILAYGRFVAAAPPAPTGQVIPVGRGNVAATVSATGRVGATRQAKLVFTNSGRIQDIQVNVGDRVTAGQVLAHLVSD